MEKQIPGTEDKIIGLPENQECRNCYYSMIYKDEYSNKYRVCMRYPQMRYNTIWCGEWKKK
jgi:hypothetical protein